MNHPTPCPADDGGLVLLALLGLWVVAEAAATLAVALVALLLALAGWRPAVRPAAPAPAPLPVVLTAPTLPPAPAADPLQALTVHELRQRARAAGLAQLARSGRKAALIEALAA